MLGPRNRLNEAMRARNASQWSLAASEMLALADALPRQMSLVRKISLWIAGFALTLSACLADPASIRGASLRAVPSSAAPAGAIALATHDGTLFVLDGPVVRVLPPGASAWIEAGRWRAAGAAERPPLAFASSALGVFVITPERVARLAWAENRCTVTGLPALPRSPSVATAAVLERKLHVVTDAGAWSLDLFAHDPAWSVLPAPPVPLGPGSALVDQLEQLTLFTPAGTCAFTSSTGWKPASLERAPFDLATAPAVARYGAAHVFFLTPSVTHAYHVPTGKWASYATPLAPELRAVSAAPAGGRIKLLVLAPSPSVFSVEALPAPTGYSWMDHAVVATYLLGMLWMSVWFARRKQSANDYFRGGNRIPWWVSGMSLFATFASGISIMGMPGKAFAGDWTYFSQSLFALLILPIKLFLLVPLVRHLKIPTANAYLERRFGLSARMLGSVIAVFSSSIARQGSVLVLPSIALSTMMGVDVVTCIVVMGLVTLSYTFFGGFTAVVWTDTIQGFIVIGAVIGCVAIAWTRIDLAPAEAWEIVRAHGKLRTFDWSTSLLYPTAWIFLLTSLIGTLGGVASQDFIQRVQCTPDLRQARLAVSTQLLVAVPLNLLLFAFGTVLFLFYHQRPEALSPAMKLDGIYPFFAAQQLPPGVSGLVVAALVAATMGAISSCNCSVSDIITQDFYKRFHPGLSDRSVLRFGRLITLVSGLVGIGTAIWMATATMGSIWDLATMVTSLISNGVVGLFTLGLLTRRAHQTGALVGVASGMLAVWLLQHDGSITFWLYTAVGTAVTVAVGYVASLVLPGRTPPLDGLTVYTLKPTPAGA